MVLEVIYVNVVIEVVKDFVIIGLKYKVILLYGFDEYCCFEFLIN